MDDFDFENFSYINSHISKEFSFFLVIDDYHFDSLVELAKLVAINRMRHKVDGKWQDCPPPQPGRIEDFFDDDIEKLFIISFEEELFCYADASEGSFFFFVRKPSDFKLIDEFELFKKSRQREFFSVFLSRLSGKYKERANFLWELSPHIDASQ